MTQFRSLRLAPFAVVCLALTLAACADGERAAADPAPAAVATPGASASIADTATPAASDSAATAPAVAGSASALIGARVPPYPDGLISIVGSCIPGGEGLEHVCDYGIAVLGRGDRDAGTAQMIYLVGSRNTDPSADMPIWEITDALDVPSADGYQLQVGECRMNDEPDSAVIALARHSEGQEVTTDVSWARRYDTAGGKFQQIDTAKISCVDPGFGI